MLKTTSPTRLSGVLLLSINVTEKDEIGDGSSNGMKSTIISKKFTKADYLNFEVTVSARAFEFLTLDTKKAFNHLRHAFTKAPIFQHFNLKRHIQIETDASGHTIGGILSQLTLDDLAQWHPMAYYLRKMILTKTQYKTHDGEPLAIFEAFKK